MPAPAGATGSYPGETLALTVPGPVVQGQQTTFIASGEQTDVAQYAGGFALQVFAKDQSVSPTCSPTYPGEQQASVGQKYEQLIVVGLWQGQGTTFRVPFVYTFPETGRVVLCAYSTWVTDTVASASLTVSVTARGSATTPSKPIVVVSPRITQSSDVLTCHRGTWRKALSYAFSWWVRGRRDSGATDETLPVTNGLKGRPLVCEVTGYNQAGRTAAASHPFFVH